MSNYNSLKTTINANIKQNGNQEITGQILNSVLNQMVTTLGAGYQFAGVATTATNPGSPDAKVFYIANGKGTYTNFGGLEVTEDDVIVLYWDSSWHKVSTGIASQEKLSELEGKTKELSSKVSEIGGGEIESTLLGDFYVLDGVMTPYNLQTCRYIKVKKGLSYIVKVFNPSSEIVVCRYGFFTSVPTSGSETTIYGGGSVAEPVVFLAENDGYLAYSCYAPNYATEVVAVKGDIENINNKIDHMGETIGQVEREVGDLNQSLNGGNIQSVELDGIYLPNGKVTAIYGQKTFYARIVKGQTLTLDIVRVSGYETATIRTGVFSSVPVLDAQAFSYSSTTDSQIVYHATDDVYFAFSIYGSYLASATFSVDSLFVTEKEFLPIKESVESITDVIGTPQKEITMVSGFYLIGSASVGSILSDKIYSNASYRCAKITCHEGDVFILSAGAGSSAGIYAFTDSDKKILVKYANDTMPLGKAEIVAPSGASFLFLNDNTNSVSFKGKGDKVSILNEVVGAIGKHNSVLDAFTLSANASKTLPLVYVRKNVTISASASAFTEIRVGVGYASYKGAWIEVDATNVKVYDYISSATQVTSYPHGLNLANGAEINIVSSKETASIIIVDAFGGVSKTDNVAWWGGGAAFITNLGNSDINGTISFNASDVSEGIWMFGDSYFSYNQTARWTHYMLEWGFDKWLANHLPGVASAVSLACFKNLVKLGKPSYIVWCLGMNDQSDANATTPNAEWLSSVNSVLSYCDANGVIPILATIPTSKNNDGTGLKYNEGKNAWVRASGRRYIDFAKAVGASGDGTWRSGLKASDIHPSEAGAKVLASQVLVDFGEITKR